MKRFIAAASTAVVLTFGGGVALAGASSPPEVDASGAQVTLFQTVFKTIRCTGLQESGGTKIAEPYETLSGAWKGSATDTMLGNTPYSLTGSFTITRVLWTINLNTQRGVVKGVATLANSAGGTVFSGPIVLITQGIVGSGSNVSARGFVNAKTYTNGSPDGGSYLLNVEFQVGAGYAGSGIWGNVSMGFQDYSVYYNNQIC